MAYLIAAISLLSITIYALSSAVTQNSSLMWVSKASSAVSSQADLIRTKVIACGAAFPAGDNGSASSLEIYRKYPKTPADGLLANVMCPGAPAGTQAIWSGRDGVFLRKLPSGFGDWGYTNDSSGIYITTASSSGLASEAQAAVVQQLGTFESSLTSNVLKIWIAKP